MRSNREVARRRLDERLDQIRNVGEAARRPPRGWIRAIREALGMSTRELGQRMGVDQSRIVRIEQAEVAGALTMETLERAAEALDCQLAYALVPRTPLTRMVREQARTKAREELAPVAQTMRLEDQEVDDDLADEHVEELAEELLDKQGLWSNVR